MAVSIAPLHSLVASVMKGVGEPELIYEASQSPHSSAMSPFQLRTLVQADLLIWIGPELEVGLSRLIARLPQGSVNWSWYRYDDVLELYPMRDTLFVAGEANFGMPHDHDHGDIDPHFWLSVYNARAFAGGVAEQLSALDPDNTDRYHQNLAELEIELQRLDEQLAERLATVSDRPFIVFHDGFQYFEQAYSLSGLGALVLNPDIPPGPRTVANLATIARQQSTLCLFHEPQYSERWLQPLVQAVPSAGIGQIDPLGVEHPLGPGLYIAMMEALADNLLKCLGSLPENGA